MIFRLLLITLVSVNHELVLGSQNLKNKSLVETLKTFLTDQPEIITFFMEISWKLSDNECLDNLVSIGTSLMAGEERALKLLDASAKPQSGVLLGNIMHMGNYDECLEIKEKYCTTAVTPHPEYGDGLNQKVAEFFNDIHFPREKFKSDLRNSYGFCVPKACNATDLQSLFDIIEDNFEIPIHFAFEEDKCFVENGMSFTRPAMIATVIFLTFAVIIASSTLYELVFYRNEKVPSVYICFSIVSNWKNLFSEKTKNDLQCLNGIAVISTMWIVLIQRFLINFLSPNVNLLHIIMWGYKIENIFFTASSMAADSFFTVSGILVVYSYFKHKDTVNEISYLKFYIYRILRSVPPLAMVILFSTTLLNYMGSGPFWPIVDKTLQKPCERHWWSTLLYVQNYLHPNPFDQCVPQAWYIAAHVHMYLLSPLILISLSRWSKATIAIVVAVMLVQIGYVFGITIYHELPATFFDLDDRLFTYLYMPTHVRGASYLVGMLCGYYIFQSRTRSLKLQNYTVLTLWSTSMLILLGILSGHFVLIAFEHTPLKAALFNSLVRVGWSLALSVLIVLCVNGYGGAVNAFLSNRAFAVLMRLNYNVYLLHGLIIFIVGGHLRTPGYFADLFALCDFWGDYFFTLAVALVWTLAFESPTVALKKILFSKA